ncbi:aldehyde dehydrogenase family protein [Rhodoferax sp.]|uniref:aldehyde dehydrogenase family protein n=1 Tax=Rhodoferax sp. TaxID=50421 RepID=UPI0025D43023|nr:aldehyde dehydrogenase family protein [Rhodoferax sp.]MCM2297226.1 aldehyde dehydrogenase family protein [Rhodoferax sp.]
MAQHFINGQWVAASSGQTLPVIDPSTGEVFDQLARGNAADVDLAVAAARAALSGPWSRLTATERGRILMKMSQLMLERVEALALQEARDTGKPYSQARNDIVVAARYCEFYGGAADKVHGQQIPYMADYHVVVLREPYGVTAHILPWNYPAQMFGRSVVPSLAMGNAVVLKPSEDACLSPLAFCELAREAGLPDGALNVVTGLGEEAGAALTAHHDIDFVTFTGSPEVGTMVQKAAAERTLKCVLELGGKSPQIVFEDADLERAATFVLKAITQNGGQTCSAGSRLLVQRSVYDRFVGMVAARFAQASAGTPAMDRDCGPLINADQKRRVEGFIRQAIDSGIPVLAQGAVAEGVPAGGFYVAPTLFGPVPRDHRLACEEVFGPVLAAIPFEDEEDAVALANATDFGLLAGIWTRDGGRQIRMAKRMQCGQVYLNCYGAGGGVELPFGGVKRSGHGREKGFLALEEFCNVKTVVQYHGQ